MLERPDEQVTDQPQVVDLDISPLGHGPDLSQRLSFKTIKPSSSMKECVGA